MNKVPRHHNVVVIGTLDTKGPEIAYLRDRLQALHLGTTVIDSGILGEPLDIVPDIDRATAATYAGTTIDALRNAGSRGRAVAGMREALKKGGFRAGEVHCPGQRYPTPGHLRRGTLRHAPRQGRRRAAHLVHHRLRQHSPSGEFA